MMKTLAADERLGIVVLVRWKQLTQDFQVGQIEECSQVKGETWRYVDACSPTLAAFQNISCSKAANVQVRESVRLKVGIRNTTVNTISVYVLTAGINNFGCPYGTSQKNVNWCKL